MEICIFVSFCRENDRFVYCISYDTIIRAKNSPQDCFLNARSNPFGYLADKNLWGTFGYPINFGPPEGI